MPKDKLKICHVASADMTVKLLLMPQLKFLMGLNYDVHAVCSPGKLVSGIEKEGIKVKTIRIKRKISPFADLVSLVELFFYFRKEKFTMVHTHGPKPGLLGQLAAKMAGVPVIVDTIHGLYFTENSPFFKKRFFMTMRRVAARCSDVIFSQNKEDIDTMIGQKISPARKMRYLGNGIDIKKFNPENFSGEIINKKRRELGIVANAKVIGTVGRLVKEKGYLDLFEAMKIVLKKHPDVLVVAVGPQEPEKKDKLDPSVVKTYGIENNILFLGQREDMAQLYAVMDIFVLASHREGFPRSVIEAMAMQKPIVVTDIRGCREEIEHNKNGLMVPMKNPEKLAEAIIFLLEHPDNAKEFARQAKLRAQKEFDEKLVFEKIRQGYEKLLEEKLNIGVLKKIKLCHVTTVDITAKFILLNLLRFLKNENYDISIVCSFGDWSSFLRKEGFFVQSITMLRRVSPFLDIVPLIRLYFFFKKGKFDIVHTHTPKAGVLGRIAARLAGVPVVIHSSHGFYTGIKIDSTTKRIILFAEKVAAYFCDMVTSQNKEDIEFATKEHIVPPSKMKFLRYGVDIERFNPLHFSGDFISRKKEELHIGNGKKIIGMVGRFVEEKGYLDLFEAFAIVKRKHPNATLLLVAPLDKEKPDALEYSIFKKYGIEKDITLLGDNGAISNVEEIYSLMDIFVLPSYREGFPYSIMEASASSKPVVATNIRGCREAVEDGVTGILVPPETPQKLAEALIYLLDNPQAMKKLGDNGRNRAETDFDEKLFFKKMEGEYNRLMMEKAIK
ncbi:MAG: glycosyltransferase family 1 protein [Candidatus Staskawiczbacteria bacterium]|nr:glycosyltransferase family 1 protein [Candidatus Staskawiczbacteria bacterium]